MSLARGILAGQCRTPLFRGFSTSARRALATPVPENAPGTAPQAKPPHIKEFKIYRWVRAWALLLQDGPVLIFSVL